MRDGSCVPLCRADLLTVVSDNHPKRTVIGTYLSETLSHNITTWDEIMNARRA